MENELLRNESSELKAEIEKSNLTMSSWAKSSASQDKLFGVQKPASDRTGLGFNDSENSSGETSTKSQLVYDKFNKISFVKASVIHDPYESMTYNDQTSQKLNHKVKAGIGFQKPENSKPSWLKNKQDKDKEKAGRKSFVPNQPWRCSTKTLTDSSTGKTVKAYSKFFHQSEMASSLFINTLHVCFESVLTMDNDGMVAMFESIVATGLKGFLACPTVIHEAALLEFFANGSVRDGLVVSTVNGVSVEISEQLLAETFELHVEGLTDLLEIPKDLVFDAKSIVSFSGKLVSISGKKKEMKVEFRLLCDILAKTISVKAGSFDAITQEKFLMMAAIICGVRINWSRIFFNILKDMVTPGSRQAKGYAIQISLLLENVPNLEMGESSEFPSSKFLTEKTVHRYIVLNDKVGMEVVTAEPRVKKTPVTKAASKKRQDIDVASKPVVKKKRTTKSKTGFEKETLETLPVEAVPLQMIAPIPVAVVTEAAAMVSVRVEETGVDLQNEGAVVQTLLFFSPQPPPDDHNRPSEGTGGSGSGAQGQSRSGLGSGNRGIDSGISQSIGNRSGSSKRRSSGGESPVRNLLDIRSWYSEIFQRMYLHEVISFWYRVVISAVVKFQMIDQGLV
ncbi:hypothetical protein F511_02033 [Dorcoceras hygrometricum]|uniref:Dystroglycan-like n=1 Tax=Dorcoceras hygrometricum TaxID=472368 RepID=A0A2Z7AW36_9LAMI|nr:hypothetical protein F511_02033 [Dorcoceras hygrometricum]